ncbi:hypothetical protein D3C78_779780 [compost metagenome]
MLVQFAVFDEKSFVDSRGDDRFVFDFNRSDWISTFLVGILDTDIPWKVAWFLAHSIYVAAKIYNCTVKALISQVLINFIGCIAFTDGTKVNGHAFFL